MSVLEYVLGGLIVMCCVPLILVPLIMEDKNQSSFIFSAAGNSDQVKKGREEGMNEKVNHLYAGFAVAAFFAIVLLGVFGGLMGGVV